MAHFLERLASFSRLILFDKRGTGLSDRVSNDELADARGADGRRPRRPRGGRLGAGGAVRALRGREHVRSLRGDLSRADDCADHARQLREAPRPRRRLPVGADGREPRGGRRHDVERNWGHFRPEDVEYYAPSRIGDEQFVRNLEQYLRRAASPGAAAALAAHELVHRRPGRPPDDPGPDARPPPHRRPRRQRRGGPRTSPSRIPGAKFVELPGARPLDLRRRTSTSSPTRSRSS